MAHILLLAPYHTGSHARWAKGLVKHSTHDIELLSLPGRFWKWRMHGAAVTFARKLAMTSTSYDLIIGTDMLDLNAFFGLARKSLFDVPTAVYFHENQLTYPPPPGQKRDLHYGFINYTTMLTADEVWFNSAYHKNVLIDELPRLLKHFPDYNELETIDEIEAKSIVLPLGIDLQRLDRFRATEQVAAVKPLTILWNHRWEYDKQPETFFKALYALQGAEIDFKVIIVGESFRNQPEEFLEAQSRLGGQIEHFGYVETLDDYAKLLWRADVQVSCAIQDFFGGSTCEAIYCNCFPILPDRLNYPSFIPDEWKERSLYSGVEQLVERLKWASENLETVRGVSLRKSVEQYDWQAIAPTYDDAFRQLILKEPSIP